MTNNIKSKNKVMLKSKPCKGYLYIKIPYKIFFKFHIYLALFGKELNF